MKRRNFLGAAGAYAAIIRRPAEAQDAGTAHKRARIDLNGAWDQSVDGHFVRTIQVPSSNRPLGQYDLSREFVLPRLTSDEHAILHFEGLAFFGRAFCNDRELGSLIPYVPHDFDIGGAVRERSNTIRVSIADLIPGTDGAGADEIALGVNRGWEAYGGIIREVWVELRPATFIENAQLRYTLEPTFRAAHCAVRAFLRSRGPVTGKAAATLLRAGRTFATGVQTFSTAAGTGEVDIAFEITDPALWSPESPDLYDVVVSIETPNSTDQSSFRTGFREFRVKGTGFELNGNRITLDGVCRHDMWKNQGFTLTRQQMRHDMQAIQAMGANYVRLVHYPHHRHVVELADELGLLVTEEPGFWQVDFRKIPRSMIDLGLNILEKTIRRDWNSPSVIGWLLANECHLTADFLHDGKALCQRIDPLARLVSAANSMPKEQAKPMFEQTGMDFFDDHPYTFDVSQFREIAEFYGNSRPLTFTEWGGKEIAQSTWVMPKTVDALLALQASSQLAGTSFWSWQDVPEFSRIDPEMRNGILESGVVTEAREPRQRVMMELRRFFEGRAETPSPHSEDPEFIPLRHTPWAPGSVVSAIELDGIVGALNQMEAWRDFERLLGEFWPKADYAGDQWRRTGRKFLLWRNRRVELLGVPFLIPSVEGYVRPIVLTPTHPEITVPVRRRCSRIHVLGHITCPGGYPPVGKSGAVAASLNVQYEGRNKQSFPLHHGFEVARGNMIYQTTRINPIATGAQRVLRFTKDAAREDYQVLLYSASVREQPVESITYQLEPGEHEQPLLIFAINTEAALPL